MAERIIGPTGSRRRRRTLIAPFLLVALVALMLTAGAQAVHDVGKFELDKNASNNLDVLPVGWLNSNISATATSINVCETGNAPSGGSIILIENEQMTVTANNAGSFGGNCTPGVKRTYIVTRAAGDTSASAHSGGEQKAEARVSLLVPRTDVQKPGPDWNQVYAEIQEDADSTCSAIGLVECSFVHDGVGPTTFTQGSSKDHLPISGWRHTSGNSADKAEILNAYAAKAVTNGDQILYFGMDRYGIDGSTDVGFWFFQNEVATLPNGTFSGSHADGDVLILGTFTQGGATSDIRVFKWVGDPETGTVGDQVVGSFGDCVPGSAGDEGCATVNNTTIEVPWTYTPKGSSKGGWVPVGGFFEGGINLTEAGLEGCFSSFLAETRSSPELTAILMDFALGSFEACDTSVVTTPVDDEGDAVTQIVLGDSIRDHALVTGIGGNDPPTGTMSFYICGPADLEEQDTCEEGGTAVNESVPPAPTGTDPPVALSAIADTNTSQATSSAFTPDAVGTWCWRGEYSGDHQYPAQADSSSGECFEVVDTSSIVTDQSWTPNDTATLKSTGGSNLAGTLTMTLYDSGNCTGTKLYEEVFTIASDDPGWDEGELSKTTTNGDGSGSGLAADKIFYEADSPVGPLSWKAVFDSDTDSADSVSPCETTSEFVIDDNDPEED